MPTDLVAYFRRLTQERSVRAIATRSGIDQTTLNRQLTGGSSLTIETVVALCRAYELDFAAVFVEVGFITEDEAKRFAQRYVLADVTDLELSAEIVRRLAAAQAGPALTEPVSSEFIDSVLASDAVVEGASATGDDHESNVTYLGRISTEELPKKHAANTRKKKADEAPTAD